MPHLPSDITLALSQFFQNDDSGLALAHALKVDAPNDATLQQSLLTAVETAAPVADRASA
jgi:hypothetical protein